MQRESNAVRDNKVTSRRRRDGSRQTGDSLIRWNSVFARKELLDQLQLLPYQLPHTQMLGLFRNFLL